MIELKYIYQMNYEKFLMIREKSSSFYLLNIDDMFSVAHDYCLVAKYNDYFILHREEQITKLETGFLIPPISEIMVVIPFNDKIKFGDLLNIIKKERIYFYKFDSSVVFKMIEIYTFNGLQPVNKFDVISIDGYEEAII